jgi:alcohol dehydrogenase
VKYRGPFAFGHETVAEVVDAGPKAMFSPGTRVAVPFQLSCGRCSNCLRGLTNSCSSFPFGAAYGLKPTSGTEFGGALSDLVHVPFADHMLVPLPAGVDPVVAASSLYAAGVAAALKAGRVLYLDDDEGRRQQAVLMGAEADRLALAAGRGPDRQFDIVVLAVGSDAALQFAVQSTGPNGILTSVMIFRDRTNAIPLTHAYYKGLTFMTGRVNSRPILPHVLDCIACGALHPEHVTHRIVQRSDAAEAMTDPGPKLIFDCLGQ